MQPRSVEANGIRVAYLEEGAGPPVVLLHGFPDTPQTWDAARAALAGAGFRAITPFLRGYPPSGLEGPYDLETIARDLLGLLDALGIERAIVVGHDWGAAASYAAAGMAPARIEQLVTVGIPHPASLRPSPRALWGVRHFLLLRLPGAAARARARQLAIIDELVRRWSPAWQVPPGETDAVKRSLAQPGAFEAAILPRGHPAAPRRAAGAHPGADHRLRRAR